MKIKVILYTSKVLSNGEHPIMIRINDGDKRKFKATGFSTTPRFWDTKDNCLRNSHPNKSLIEKLIDNMIKEIKDRKLELESEQKDFTADMLMDGTKKLRTSNLSVFQYWKEIIERLVASKSAGNAKVYADAKNALENFTQQRDVSFSVIDIQFLNRYEAHLRSKGCADNSISVRFRTLRALFNKAIEEGHIKPTCYPFDKFKISKFNTNTERRAITKEEMKKIEKVKVKKGSPLFETQHYFVFSYYGAGMNFRDIANLKWSNISNDRVLYTRSKTGKVLNFKLSDPAQKIINYWKPITGSQPDNYVFPIFDKDRHISDMQKHNRANKVIGNVNSNLKTIAKLAKIKTHITTYVARHTFATVLKKSGNTETSIISEAMGHKTEAITQTYLKSFENETVDNAMKNLL